MSAVLDVVGLSPLDLPMDDAFGASAGFCGEDSIFPSFVAETSGDSAATRLAQSSAAGSKQELADTSHQPSTGFHTFCDFSDLPPSLYSGDSSGPPGLVHRGSATQPPSGPLHLPQCSFPDPDEPHQPHQHLRKGGHPEDGMMHPGQVLYSFPLEGQDLGKFAPYSLGDGVQHGGHHLSMGLQTPCVGPPSFKPPMPLLEPSLTSGQRHWEHGVRDDEDAIMSSRLGYSASRSRWKPNSQQLCLLEQHFKSGYTKATPELFLAVKNSGPSTEAQVSVWLKNRLARCRRHPKGDKLDGGSGEDSSGGNEKQLKRAREEENVWEDFASIQSSVFDELSSILRSIDSAEVLSLAKSIKAASNICCYGVGREGLVMKGFAANLFQLGLDASVVGETSAPMLGKGDLFLAAAGPSYYGTVTALSLEARRSGADVIAFTAHKTAPLPYARQAFRIASQTLPPNMPVMNRKLGGLSSDVVSSLPDGKFSVLPMGASFEVSLSIILECVCVMLRKKMNVQVEDMCARCNNLC